MLQDAVELRDGGEGVRFSTIRGHPITSFFLFINR